MKKISESLKVEGKMNFNLIGITHPIVETVADKILIPTNMGGVMILKNRAPLFLSVTCGALWIYNEGQDPVCYLVSSGIAEIRRNICSVLAFGQKLDKIKQEIVLKDLEKVQKLLSTTHCELGRQELLRHIQYLNLLKEAYQFNKAPSFL